MAALVACSGPAFADESPAPKAEVERRPVYCAAIAGGNPRLELLDAEMRIRFLDQSLRRGAYRARFWAWSWAGIYSALTLGSLVLAITADDDDGKLDNYFGAGASAVGLAVLAILPLKIMSDETWWEKRLKRTRPDEDRCAVLADAERLLVRDAESEAFGAGALVHVGNFLFNAALGVILGAVWGHWNQAAINALAGVTVGELQTLTQPTDVVRALRRYRSGQLGPPGKLPPAWLIVPEASREHVGLRFALSF